MPRIGKAALQQVRAGLWPSPPRSSDTRPFDEHIVVSHRSALSPRAGHDFERPIYCDDADDLRSTIRLSFPAAKNDEGTGGGRAVVRQFSRNRIDSFMVVLPAAAQRAGQRSAAIRQPTATLTGSNLEWHRRGSCFNRLENGVDAAWNGRGGGNSNHGSAGMAGKRPCSVANFEISAGLQRNGPSPTLTQRTVPCESMMNVP